MANLSIGWWAHRKATTGSFEDYALASRNLAHGGAGNDVVGDVCGHG
ncbi:MAG: hypothetical protein AAF335_03950 [Bacteroidota bacterium]